MRRRGDVHSPMLDAARLISGRSRGIGASGIRRVFDLGAKLKEPISPGPVFVNYPRLCRMVGAKAVYCDTYPDFMMTAERVEPLSTKRTKMVLLNTPGNPSGAVLSQKRCSELLELCRARGVLLV